MDVANLSQFTEQALARTIFSLFSDNDRSDNYSVSAAGIFLDYAKHNIRANAVCPGTIETPLYHKAIDSYLEKSGRDSDEVHAEEAALQPLGRLGQPDEVAQLCYFLASEHAEFITGSLQVIDGGYTAQ